MEINYSSNLDRCVLSWLEVKEGRPSFQKRIYKNVEQLKQYIMQLFETKADKIDNVQLKVCYKLKSNKEA